mmetsp:Transcript_7705/g.14296  ORF Transcript_7705/g.14296 Transcript_7705/m.14296 type:complete len:325 (+) Transcript_7705:670-1644(+)
MRVVMNIALNLPDHKRIGSVSVMILAVHLVNGDDVAEAFPIGLERLVNLEVFNFMRLDSVVMGIAEQGVIVIVLLVLAGIELDLHIPGGLVADVFQVEQDTEPRIMLQVDLMLEFVLSFRDPVFFDWNELTLHIIVAIAGTIIAIAGIIMVFLHLNFSNGVRVYSFTISVKSVADPAPMLSVVFNPEFLGAFRRNFRLSRCHLLIMFSYIFVVAATHCVLEPSILMALVCDSKSNVDSGFGLDRNLRIVMASSFCRHAFDFVGLVTVASEDRVLLLVVLGPRGKLAFPVDLCLVRSTSHDAAFHNRNDRFCFRRSHARIRLLRP